jgi:hypothetical protein
VLASGRSSATYTTATTGVRGLSEEELQNAKPNPQAVAALEQLAVTPDDARSFARKAKLKADPALLKEVQSTASCFSPWPPRSRRCRRRPSTGTSSRTSRRSPKPPGT